MLAEEALKCLHLSKLLWNERAAEAMRMCSTRSLSSHLCHSAAQSADSSCSFRAQWSHFAFTSGVQKSSSHSESKNMGCSLQFGFSLLCVLRPPTDVRVLWDPLMMNMAKQNTHLDTQNQHKRNPGQITHSVLMTLAFNLGCSWNSFNCRLSKHSSKIIKILLIWGKDIKTFISL